MPTGGLADGWQTEKGPIEQHTPQTLGQRACTTRSSTQESVSPRDRLTSYCWQYILRAEPSVDYPPTPLVDIGAGYVRQEGLDAQRAERSHPPTTMVRIFAR